MASLTEMQMQQVTAAIEQSKEANNNIIGKFLKDADEKLAKMEEVAQALYLEVATQTKRVDERVVDLNALKDIALSQTNNLNDRSIEIEQKLLLLLITTTSERFYRDTYRIIGARLYIITRSPI